MPTAVVKFGGSVLHSKQDFDHIIEVVKKYPQPLVIVVSALSGVSQLLTESLKKARNDDQTAQKVFDRVYQLKKDLLEAIVSNESLRTKTLGGLKASLTELHQYLKGISLTGDASPALEDHVLSYGEKLSALFLNGILLNDGLNSKVVFPESIGLFTDGEYGNASVDFSRSMSGVKSALSRGLIYIVPGSYGISTQSKITMLGHSGSDYLAASLAKLLGAGSVDVWKSANGFLSADPELVENPVQIKMLTYEEAAELAYFGTKLLHPRAVEPLIDSHIPIRIFNLNGRLDVGEPLSIVNSEKTVTGNIVKSITYSDDFGVLKLKGPGVGINPGILAKATTALYKAGINIISVLTSQISINILLAKSDLPNAYSLIKDIELSAVGDVEVIKNIAVVVAIGNGLAENYGVASRIYTALAREKINVLMSCSGASPIVSYFLVKEDERTRAVRAVHQEFFETNNNKQF
jgi:bifunctional aspartokinase / homoserine dehydrogenase 1